MKISEYVANYTHTQDFTFGNILKEIRELFVEVFKFNRAGIKEEFGDVVHFIQLYLFRTTGLNGEVWKLSENSTQKFMKRKLVWIEIYKSVGLSENISNFCGNYNRVEKVIWHLQRLEISEDKAREAYNKVMLKINERE